MAGPNSLVRQEESRIYEYLEVNENRIIIKKRKNIYIYIYIIYIKKTTITDLPVI